jgi:transposase
MNQQAGRRKPRTVFAILVETLRALDEGVWQLDAEIARRAKKDEAARRHMSVLGIGPITASALIAPAPKPATFTKGRDFGARVGRGVHRCTKAP